MGRVKKRRGTSLSAIFLRYLLIMLGALFVLGICIIVTFNILVNTGAVYPANYAEKKISEAYEIIQNADEVTEDVIPPLCRFVVFTLNGDVVSGNMQKDSIKIAWEVVNDGQASGRYFYKVIKRQDEYVVLQYSLTPQYRSAFLRENLIGPQELIAIIGILSGTAIILSSSLRFGRKMKLKMQPLMDAVDRIKQQDLEYEASYCGVKEIDDCLLSIDEMRNALKDSLERQWNVEQEKNRQMSALAHDIKTPLTVVRGNAELLSETDLTEEQKTYTDYISGSALQIQKYVQTLIEVTKSVEGYQYSPENVSTEELLCDIKKQAYGLAEIYNFTINWKEQYNSEIISVVYDQIVRAVMNVITNAAEHTAPNGAIDICIEEPYGKLKFIVEDTGIGFTKEALKHGTEQFFMDDASRNNGIHYGIGLFTAKTIAEKHGGEILLANSERTGGAKVSISICTGTEDK